MASPQVVTVGPLAAANAALIVASATPVSGTPMTLTGSQPDKPRKILVTYGAEASGRTMKITGTNHSGNPISETLAIPSGGAGTVATTQDFATVTQVLPGGGGWSAAATVGTNSAASSPWQMLDTHLNPMNVGIGVVVSGTANYTVEYTYDDPNQTIAAAGSAPPTAWPLSALATKTANTDAPSAFANAGIFAWRLTLNSGSGSATATAIQSGLTP